MRRSYTCSPRIRTSNATLELSRHNSKSQTRTITNTKSITQPTKTQSVQRVRPFTTKPQGNQLQFTLKTNNARLLQHTRFFSNEKESKDVTVNKDSKSDKDEGGLPAIKTDAELDAEYKELLNVLGDFVRTTVIDTTKPLDNQPAVVPFEPAAVTHPPLSKLDRARYEYLPTEVPKGMLSYALMNELLLFHQKDPQTWTYEKLAERYKVEVDKVELLIKYASASETTLPPIEGDTTKIAARPKDIWLSTHPYT